MRNHVASSAAGITVLAIWFLAILGWILNIFDIVEMVNSPVTGMFVLRCVGIFIAPLGSVLGYF